MRIAIQGEKGSNSHMAAMQMFADMNSAPEIVACALSSEVFASVVRGDVEGAVLPIENSLHGSVAEHYDLLLTQPVKIARESSMRIRHNVIACPGVRMDEIRSVLSHPVALAQCRRWQAQHPEIQALPFYDTAGGVKHITERGLRDVAAIAPWLAAEVYGGEVLVQGIEDHAENFTRFHWVVREDVASAAPEIEGRGIVSEGANKLSVAFAVEHRPGTLVEALEGLSEAGADLTKIESRPVPGRPWEYIFYVDLRFGSLPVANEAVSSLRGRCGMVKELGRYVAAERE